MDAITTSVSLTMGRRSTAGGGWGTGLKKSGLPVAVIVVVILLIELISRTGLVSPAVLPAPSATAVTLFSLLGDAILWNAVGQTLLATGTGFLIAAVVGIPLGLLLGFSFWLRESTRMIIEFLRPIPPMALLPLAVLLLGTGISVKVALVAFGASFPLLIQSIAGAQEADPVARETGRVYGFDRWQQIRWILWPSALPNIFTGIRLGAIVALTVTIATELVVGSDGLGYLINQARFAELVPRMYALILLTGVLGMLVSFAVRQVERVALKWHVSTRQGVQS